ncbi:hypothetical protein BGX28_004004 [Mortierella sp. GBA30]|nr:hypothetical protein BGX28_004004 [Mortierella sp. GBA30]
MSDQPSAERIPGNKRSGYRGSAARKALETPALSHISQEATTTSSEVCDTKKQHEEEEATSVEAALEPAGCSMNPYISLVARRMRTLRKRIARIEASEKILSSDPQGKTKINPDQLQAVARKTEATAPLKELEELSKFMLAQYAKDRDANAATSTDHAQELERTKQQISQEHEDSSTVHFIHLISLFFVLKELEVAERILDPDLSRCLKTLRSFRSMLFEAASAAEMVGDEKHKVGLNMLVRNLAEATPEIADETDTFTFLLKEARIKDDAENNMELAVSSVTATAEGMKMLENVGQHATQSRSPLSIQPVFMTGTETVITLEQRNAIHDSTTTSQPIEVPRDIPAANSKTSNTAPKSEIITEPLVLHSEDSHQQSYIVAVRPVHEYGFASGPWTVSGPQLVHPYPLHARPQLPQILTQSGARASRAQLTADDASRIRV